MKKELLERVVEGILIFLVVALSLFVAFFMAPWSPPLLAHAAVSITPNPIADPDYPSGTDITASGCASSGYYIHAFRTSTGANADGTDVCSGFNGTQPWKYYFNFGILNNEYTIVETATLESTACHNSPADLTSCLAAATFVSSSTVCIGTCEEEATSTATSTTSTTTEEQKAMLLVVLLALFIASVYSSFWLTRKFV